MLIKTYLLRAKILGQPEFTIDCETSRERAVTVRGHLHNVYGPLLESASIEEEEHQLAGPSSSGEHAVEPALSAKIATMDPNQRAELRKLLDEPGSGT